MSRHRADLVDAYLRRLGVDDPGPPSVEGLRRLHAAHVERIAYEALDAQFGRAASIVPTDALVRIAGRGRGGYCYHLNGAFSVLLGALGYDVVWHRAGVQITGEPPPGSELANHLALTVHGLDDGDGWLADVGLGDGLYEPLPLAAGQYAQGPFTYRLSASTVDPGGWRFEHDEHGSFAGMDFAPWRAEVRHFAARHRALSTSDDSGFVRTCTVQRRDATGVDSLTGCVLRRIPGGTTVLDRPHAWFAALADVFGLPLADLSTMDRQRLWTRVYAAHEVWSSRG